MPVIPTYHNSTSPRAGAKNLIFCSIFSIFIDFDAIFNGNWPRMIASEPGNIGNLPGMIVSFPGNISWTVRSIFVLYYSSYMDRTTHIWAVIYIYIYTYIYIRYMYIYIYTHAYAYVYGYVSFWGPSKTEQKNKKLLGAHQDKE